jgi:hypothetical protein
MCREKQGEGDGLGYAGGQLKASIYLFKPIKPEIAGGVPSSLPLDMEYPIAD